MRSAIVLALMLAVMAGAHYGVSSPAWHEQVAATDKGSIGSIVVGLILLSPLFGLFVIFRRFGRWQRGFHHRMTTQGAWRPGPRP